MTIAYMYNTDTAQPNLHDLSSKSPRSLIRRLIWQNERHRGTLSIGLMDFFNILHKPELPNLSLFDQNGLSRWISLLNLVEYGSYCSERLKRGLYSQSGIIHSPSSERRPEPHSNPDPWKLSEFNQLINRYAF